MRGIVQLGREFSCGAITCLRAKTCRGGVPFVPKRTHVAWSTASASKACLLSGCELPHSLHLWCLGAALALHAPHVAAAIRRTVLSYMGCTTGTHREMAMAFSAAAGHTRPPGVGMPSLLRRGCRRATSPSKGSKDGSIHEKLVVMDVYRRRMCGSHKYILVVGTAFDPSTSNC